MSESEKLEKAAAKKADGLVAYSAKNWKEVSRWLRESLEKDTQVFSRGTFVVRDVHRPFAMYQSQELVNGCTV